VRERLIHPETTWATGSDGPTVDDVHLVWKKSRVSVAS